MHYQYLTIYSTMQVAQFVGTFNSATGKWSKLNCTWRSQDGGLDPYKILGWGLYGYWHVTPNLADTPRTKLGEIVKHALPTKFTPEQVHAYFTNNGPKPKRILSAASMDNLKLGGLKEENRYTPQQIVLDEHLVETEKLRDAGLSWRDVGQTLQLNPNSIRTALRRHQDRFGS